MRMPLTTSNAPLGQRDGIANELDYVEQISWVLFLKYLSDLETERQTRAELDGVEYRSRH